MAGKEKLPFYIFRHNETSIDDTLKDLEERVEKLEDMPPGDVPGPDTVGTEQVKNGSLLLEDMDPDNFAKNSDIDEIFND